MPNDDLRKRDPKTDHDLLDEWLGFFHASQKGDWWHFNRLMQNIEDELGFHVIYNKFVDHSKFTKADKEAFSVRVTKHLVDRDAFVNKQLKGSNFSALRERIEALEKSDGQHATNTANTHMDTRECMRKIEYIVRWATLPWWRRLFAPLGIRSKMDEQMANLAQQAVRPRKA
jgi:hypothetical protein